MYSFIFLICLSYVCAIGVPPLELILITTRSSAGSVNCVGFFSCSSSILRCNYPTPMDSYVRLPLPPVSPGYTRDATSVSAATFTGGSITRFALLQPLQPIYYNKNIIQTSLD